MKRTLLLLLLLATTAASAQTRYDISMTLEGVERQCIVVRPSGAAPANGYPVVFMFHGTSGDGEKFYNISGWKEKGEAEKFITVFPSSLRYCFIDDEDTTRQVSTTKWNCGESQQKKCDGVVMKDDIAFVRALIDTVTRMAPVDRRRIYATGFSNGGVFTSKLAVEMSDVFAAVAAAAGPLNELDSTAPARPVPFAFTIGDQDPKLLAAIGRPIPFNDSCLQAFGGMIARYRGVFNLASTFERDSTALALIYRFTTPADGGRPSSRMLFSLMRNLSHEYPNGTNYPVAAADFLWTFFSGQSLPSSVGTTAERAARINVSPNPASSHLVVRGPGTFTITLWSVTGLRVFSTRATDGEHIPLPELAPGAYIAEITAAGRRTGQMVIIER